MNSLCFIGQNSHFPNMKNYDLVDANFCYFSFQSLFLPDYEYVIPKYIRVKVYYSENFSDINSIPRYGMYRRLSANTK